MDEDTLLPFALPSIGRKKLTAAFDGGRLTSDGGVMRWSPDFGSPADGVDGPRRHRCAKVRVVRTGRKGATRDEHYHDRR